MDISSEWFPDWSRDVVAVVGSGESATPDAVESLRGRARVIVVNNGYQLARWADALYAADGKWWDHYRDALQFKGLKITCNVNAARVHKINRVQVRHEAAADAHEIHLSGPIGHGGNSGFQALNLAVQFGGRRIIAVGFEFRGSRWHGRHPDPLHNPYPQRMESWRKRLDDQARNLEKLGVRMIVASQTSALTAYPKMNVEGALRLLAAETANV